MSGIQLFWSNLVSNDYSSAPSPPPPSSKLKSFKEAINVLVIFLKHQDHMTEAMGLGATIHNNVHLNSRIIYITNLPFSCYILWKLKKNKLA